MKNLYELIKLCKGSVSLNINPHRDIYQSIETYLSDDRDKISDNTYNNIIKNDTLVELVFYPDTPVSNYTVYHYDIDTAIKTAIGIINYR